MRKIRKKPGAGAGVGCSGGGADDPLSLSAMWKEAKEAAVAGALETGEELNASASGSDDDKEGGNGGQYDEEDGMDEGKDAEEDTSYIPPTLDDALRPRLGMVFASVKEAYSLYRAFAFRNGFTPIRRTVHNTDGARYRSTFTCSFAAKPRHSTRETPSCCKAMMIIRDRNADNRWKVEYLGFEHNHGCVPDMVRFLKAFREMPEELKMKLKITDEMAGLVERSHSEMSESRRLRSKRSAKSEELRCLGEVDVEMLLRFISDMQAKYADFVHCYDFDECGRVSGVFWADARAREQYRFFGDVVAIDVAYVHAQVRLVPLVMFIGVNNHGHYILLGCAVLAEESKDSYVWLLRKWLASMRVREPQAITTHYSDVATKAVAEVLPAATHRFCPWSIMRKLSENLNTPEKEAICSAFKEVVYGNVTVTDFEREWNAMTEKCNLKNSEWVSNLFSCRRQWVPAYVNHQFWAGMSPIRIGERPDAYFDGVVMAKTRLDSFLEQYDTVVKAKVEKEVCEDHRSMCSRLLVLSGLPFEEQIGELYTIRMFQAFQDEIKQLMHVICIALDKNGPTVTYTASELVDGKKTDFAVVYNSSDRDVWCICRSFQSRGILCSHALAVLKQEQVLLLPSKFIVNRWRKDFKQIQVSAGASSCMNGQELCLYDELYQLGHLYLADIIDFGSKEEEMKEFVLSAMTEAKEKVIKHFEADETGFDANVWSAGGARVDVNMETTETTPVDSRVDVNCESAVIMTADRIIDVNVESTSMIPNNRRVDGNQALPTTASMDPNVMIFGDRRADRNMFAAANTSAHVVGYAYNLLNVNMECEDPLQMAPADLMQMNASIFPQKLLLHPRDEGADDNSTKRPNIGSQQYFMGGGMHVG